MDADEAGSDARLQAAKQLQARLKLILEGEPPYDLFVRWKPLSKQAIGWHPDINDGVRLNIRPFLAQDIPAAKKAPASCASSQTSSGRRTAGRNPRGTRRISRGSGAGMRRSKTLPGPAKSRTAIGGTTATIPMSSRSGRERRVRPDELARRTASRHPQNSRPGLCRRRPSRALRSPLA